jgi:signal transduction histidine kinase
MTLVHRDGEFIARSRDLQKVLGRMAPRDRAYFHPDAPAYGVFRGPSAVDPSDKIFGWRRIPGTELIVSAGLDTATTLGPVDREIAEDINRTAAIVLLIVVLGAAIAILLLQFARQQERLMLSERRMAALNDELEERVRLRTVELEALVKELETFNYAVAHDLNTSLGVMSVNAGMLLHDLGERLSGDQRHVLGGISENAQLAARLLDDLREHSRLGREAIERRPVAMRDLVMEAWRPLAMAKAGRQVSFEAGELPECNGDRRMLAQLWMNLLSNALKYTKMRAQARIEVGYDAAQNAYFVRDDGISFDMQYAHKLFNVFERLHREEHFDGTGIGLAIAARIVQRHGGRIWAEARSGEGATFYFTLPPAAGGT